MVAAGLEADIHRGPASQSTGTFESTPLGMGAAAAIGHSLADHGAAAHDDSADGRIREGTPFGPTGQIERTLHVADIVVGESPPGGLHCMSRERSEGRLHTRHPYVRPLPSGRFTRREKYVPPDFVTTRGMFGSRPRKAIGRRRRPLPRREGRPYLCGVARKYLLVLMVKVPRAEDVLLSHACRGDPSAFLTLLGPLLAATFGSLRQAETPDSARDKLIELACHLYRRLTVGRFRLPLDEWYRTEAARVLPSVEQAPDAAAVSLDTQLEHSLEQAIQREYSALLRTRGTSRRNGGVGARLMSRPGVFAAAAGGVLLVIVVVVLQLIWSRTGTRVELRLTTGERAYGIAFPFGSDITQPSPVTVSAEQAADTAVTASDSARIDSVVQEDREESAPQTATGRRSASRTAGVAKPKPKPKPKPPSPPPRRAPPAPPSSSKPAAPPEPPAPKAKAKARPEPELKQQPQSASTPVPAKQPSSTPAAAPVRREPAAEPVDSPAVQSERPSGTASASGETAAEKTASEPGLGDLDFSEWPSDSDSEESSTP